MSVRLGEVLVRRGLLTEEQVRRIVEEQARTPRPFGVLAEQLCGVAEADIEAAWAEQYEAIAGKIDVAAQTPEPGALGTVTRRQAWQFRVLPLREEGGELVMATTREHLPRALRFAVRVLERSCYFVLTEPRSLGEGLAEHFPMAGLCAEDVCGPGVAPAA